MEHSTQNIYSPLTGLSMAISNHIGGATSTLKADVQVYCKGELIYDYKGIAYLQGQYDDSMNLDIIIPLTDGYTHICTIHRSTENFDLIIRRDLLTLRWQGSRSGQWYQLDIQRKKS